MRTCGRVSAPRFLTTYSPRPDDEAILSLESGSGPGFEPAMAFCRKRGFVNGAAFGGYQASAFNQLLHLDLS